MAEIVASAEVNESKPHVIHNRSRFNLSHRNFDTHRFGYYAPHFVIDGVPGDKLRVRSQNDLRSYSLKAPLLQNITRHLDYVKVDLPSIIPLNFDKFYQNPTIGDDVSPNVGLCVGDFPRRVFNAFEHHFSGYKASFINGISDYHLTILFKLLTFAECFFSRGSLLASLHCDISNCLTISHDSKGYKFDEYYDLIINHCFGVWFAAPGSSFNVYIDNNLYTVTNTPSSNDQITPRHFLEEIRQTGRWNFYTNDTLGANIFNGTMALSSDILLYVGSTIDINVARVFAYQLAVSEFFTNDFVDYIYSSELYRQFIGDLVKDTFTVFGQTFPMFFTYNGVDYQYDFLSAKYLEQILDLCASNNGLADNATMQYFLSLFSYRRSLRYKDYFVGSRTRPLAVGDVNVNVSSNQFSVVDVSRKIQVQRFLNAVNHTGRRLSNYIKTMFGEDIKQDRHVPHFVMNLTEDIYSTEVENTGAAQLSQAQTITSNFRSNSGNYEVEIGVDIPCIIIGLTSYDIERSYVGGIDKHFLIRDRFDMFLPQLQFVGDQAVELVELQANTMNPGTFGYQFRNMEDKIVPSRSHGGFIGYLPGFNFAYNPIQSYRGTHISPDFIRSLASELDSFYVALTGWSLGTYFHFIVSTHNHVDASREMIANPEILG